MKASHDDTQLVSAVQHWDVRSWSHITLTHSCTDDKELCASFTADEACYSPLPFPIIHNATQRCCKCFQPCRSHMFLYHVTNTHIFHLWWPYNDLTDESPISALVQLKGESSFPESVNLYVYGYVNDQSNLSLLIKRQNVICNGVLFHNFYIASYTQ